MVGVITAPFLLLSKMGIFEGKQLIFSHSTNNRLQCIHCAEVSNIWFNRWCGTDGAWCVWVQMPIHSFLLMYIQTTGRLKALGIVTLLTFPCSSLLNWMICSFSLCHITIIKLMGIFSIWLFYSKLYIYEFNNNNREVRYLTCHLVWELAMNTTVVGVHVLPNKLLSLYIVHLTGTMLWVNWCNCNVRVRTNDLIFFTLKSLKVSNLKFLSSVWVFLLLLCQKMAFSCYFQGGFKDHISPDLLFWELNSLCSVTDFRWEISFEGRGSDGGHCDPGLWACRDVDILQVSSAVRTPD